MECFQVAVDGPVGVGKSTVAKLAARKTGFLYIDSGAMYRAVALYVIKRLGAGFLDNEDAIRAILPDIMIEFENRDGEQRVFLNGDDVTADIRDNAVSLGASAVARHSSVRRELVERQRKLAGNASVIMDGRDIGSRVLAGAELKIYLDAEPDVRAKRRYDELLAKGASADYDEIKRDVLLRDYNDKNRADSPLIKTDDAVLVDTSHIGPEEAAEIIVDLIRRRGGLR